MSAQIDSGWGNTGIEDSFLLLELHVHVFCLTPEVKQYHSGQVVKTVEENPTLLFLLKNPKHITFLSSIEIYFSKHLKAEAEAALLVGRSLRQQKSTSLFLDH